MDWILLLYYKKGKANYCFGFVLIIVLAIIVPRTRPLLALGTRRGHPAVRRRHRLARCYSVSCLWTASCVGYCPYWPNVKRDRSGREPLSHQFRQIPHLSLTTAVAVVVALVPALAVFVVALLRLPPLRLLLFVFVLVE